MFKDMSGFNDPRAIEPIFAAKKLVWAPNKL